MMPFFFCKSNSKLCTQRAHTSIEKCLRIHLLIVMLGVGLDTDIFDFQLYYRGKNKQLC